MWVDRWPGLPEESDRLLAELPSLLRQADRRAERILATPLSDPATLVRLGRLLARGAPELLPALRRRDAKTVVPALANLALQGGPTYVKLGQLISSTRGLAPEWIADAFAGCRDAVPPAATERIVATLDRSGITPKLRSWERRPIASASVAQVHRATLLDGTDVVLKIRRPGVVGTVAADAAYLLPLLRVVEGRNEKLRLANLHGTVELMVRLFAQEVDLRLEAANIVDMALAFERAGAGVQVPAPIPGLITERVVALEYVEGRSAAVADVAELGHRSDDLVRLAIMGTLHTTLVDGIFHGDLHLGNVLVNAEGLALIDFGITGRLSPKQRKALMALLLAAMTEDRSAIFAALKDFGALPADTDLVVFEAQLPPRLTRDERRALRHGDRDAMGERVTTVVRALSASGFSVPPELTLFAKNLVYLGDAVNRHAPSFDLLNELGSAVTHLMTKLPDSAA
jgi:predicted unusual protein kinase regulating ubiquinone biosynthesis (AarF/ABC1/UbiB family)